MGSHGYRINADLVSRASRYPDTIGELRFLTDRGFIGFDEPSEYHQSAYWSLIFPQTINDFDHAFFDFMEKNRIDLKTVIVTLDFSGFGISTEIGAETDQQ